MMRLLAQHLKVMTSASLLKKKWVLLLNELFPLLVLVKIFITLKYCFLCEIEVLFLFYQPALATL